jgi:cystathionine beta-lyase
MQVKQAKRDPHTQLIHTGYEVCRTTGAAAVPIYQSSMYDQPGLTQPGPYDYARSGNPTRAAVEGALATLEGAAGAYAFASGMAAITAVLMTLSAGDHMVVTDDCYGGTYRVLTRVFRRFGITATFVDTSDPEAVEAAIRPETKLLLVESLSNPFLKRTDITAMAAIARAHGIRLAVDNTMLSPYLSRPIEQGADLVIHSATKFLGGHSDLVAGVVAVRDEALAQEIYFIQNATGGVLGPQDCFLLLRGIKTLGVRLERQAQTARAVAAYLRGHPLVEAVFDPGVGAVLSFRLSPAVEMERFVQALQIPLLGVSLGAVESILTVPAFHSHASVPAAERERRGITAQLCRLSVGLEAAADLVADLEQALAIAAVAVHHR